MCKMTVRELYEQLMEYPEDAEIKIAWDDTPMKDGVYEYYDISVVFHDQESRVVAIGSDYDS